MCYILSMQSVSEFGSDKPPHNQTHHSNEITSSIIHMLGVAMSIVILIVLIVQASKNGGAEHVVAFSLYGSFMILLFAGSATFHMIPARFTRAKEIAQRIDHAAIYLFIAATYTPVTWIALPAGWGWSLFGVVWGLALFGAIGRMAGWKLRPWLLAALYVVMGWLLLLALRPLTETLNGAAFWLLLTGGFSYTAGVIFYILDHKLRKRKYFWMHEIFHIFVLGGSIQHVIVMFYLLKI